MRFAYIDSNGNEVPIPSVDALALRIELGAISDDTELYDAQADQWGPATSHEIYHTLSRSSGEDDGFIAPPPVAPPPVATEAPESEAGESEAGESEARESEAPESESEAGVVDVADLSAPVDADTASEAEPPMEDEVLPEPDALPDLDLTLAPEPQEPVDDDEAPAGQLDLHPPEEAPAAAEESDLHEAAGELGLDTIDLAPSLEPMVDEVAEPPVEQSEGVAAGAVEADGDETSDEGDGKNEAGFDFGDMGGGLEVEATFDPPDDDGSAMDFSAPSDLSGGMEIESAMDFSGGGLDSGDEGSLELERPMSEFSAEDPPAWMDHADATSDDDGDVMDFSSDQGDPDDVPLRDRRTPRNKPSKPKQRRQSAMAVPIFIAVVVVALGVGGYAAWPILSERISGGGEPDVEPTFIPQISAELMPRMRAAAEASFEITFAAARANRGSGDAVASPSTDWLAGIYLANASDYEQVEVFWDEMDLVLEGVQAIDLATFDAALMDVLEASAASQTDAAALRERADSGFVAAAGTRTVIFDQLQRLIDASVLLHQFLAVNQANIAYAPANAVTTDPVLEVNPATDEIRGAMEDLIDDVTRALGDLGYREEVTAAGLWATVLERIQATGIQ